MGLFFFLISSFAAEVPKIRFSLPAAPAEQSLKRFAAQSGLEVLFTTETAAKVRTNAVEGEYTAKAAIDQMLKGTPLVANQDQKTGAMKVSRNPDPNVARAAQATASDRPIASERPNQANHLPPP